MRISEKGLEIIKKYEGFRNHVYVCPSGIPTIGYGITFYGDGTRVKLTDKPITKVEAERLLKKVVAHFERGVNDLVKKPLTQNQFDAMVSFAYNLGLGALRSSTLLKKVNRNPDDMTIDVEFKKWVLSNGIELKGLRKRRNSEAYLYFSEIA